jgi:hypothetical protein
MARQTPPTDVPEPRPTGPVVVPFSNPASAAKGDDSVTASPPTPPRPAAASVETVILSPSGDVLRGANVPGLPEAAAYAAQMADLMGEFLGLDGFRSLEARFADAQVLMARGSDGAIAVRRARSPGALDHLKSEIGL